MNKNIGFILSVLFGIVTFFAGIQYSLNVMEKQVDVWDSNYQIITDKVLSFEKVSDPKTIRLYVNELNKLLDDMNRLGTLIDGGNELDIILVNYEKEYIKLHTKVFELIDEVELVEKKLLNQNITLSDFTDVNMEKIDELKKKIDQQRQYTADTKVSLESKLKDVENDVIIIKDSKYGKKIWKIKKKWKMIQRWK